ncbi:thiamine phosphate synthase [Extibacter muris]|uniref:Thiamine phosphate synthase n=1 Tax=Extibacter muris TaxID=1796622 RepID=A0A4R4FDQ0_9FIRM|nr:thiamine phosphate synthase [Extibacter muris]
MPVLRLKELPIILGGCTMVQLREKDSSSLAFYRQAREVKRITDQYQVPLIINDRLDIALAVKASGIHIEQSDLLVPVIREIIGKDMPLGVSVSSTEEAGQAMEDGAANQPSSGNQKEEPAQHNLMPD